MAQSIRFVFPPEGDDEPDPIGTYWTDEEFVLTHLDSLDPGEPLVIHQDAATVIDLAAYNKVLGLASEQGRDVVIKLIQE